MQVTYNELPVDAAVLLYHLYHGTRAVGMGVFHNKSDFSLDDAREIIAGREKEGLGFRFDYVYGRPIKVCADPSGVIGFHEPRLYDRDAGPGAFEEAFTRAFDESGE